MELRLHEVHEVAALKQFIKFFKINCVFDVGANTGQYAKMLREKVGYTGDILSFEPFSQAFRELSKNSSDDTHWHVFNNAISNETGERLLNLVSSSQMNSLETPSTDETELLCRYNTLVGSEKVNLVSLDEIFEKIMKKTVNFRPLLKLDTQGHDLTILKGSRLLSNFYGVQAEISFKSLYHGAPKYHETINYLEQAGFELTAIFPNNAGHFPYLIEQDILAFNSSCLSTA